ncbi:MAG: hypothetical protein K5660_03605 [Paludibacteraceae bacterium]|nr:hypothetical protein [Paludibacteraceae bacterium]
MLLSGCRSQQVTSTATTNHTAAQIQRDSIYLHDSIVVTYILGESGGTGELSRMRRRNGDNVVLNGAERQSDTIFVEREKWHTRWREKEINRTDTIQVETVRTETVQVRYVPKFYKYCAALTALLLLFLFIKFVLWLYRRFHP